MRWRTSSGRTSRLLSPPVNGSRAPGAIPASWTACRAASRLRSCLVLPARAIAGSILTRLLAGSCEIRPGRPHFCGPAAPQVAHRHPPAADHDERAVTEILSAPFRTAHRGAGELAARPEHALSLGEQAAEAARAAGAFGQRDGPLAPLARRAAASGLVDEGDLREAVAGLVDAERPRVEAGALRAAAGTLGDDGHRAAPRVDHRAAEARRDRALESPPLALAVADHDRAAGLHELEAPLELGARRVLATAAPDRRHRAHEGGREYP